MDLGSNTTFDNATSTFEEDVSSDGAEEIMSITITAISSFLILVFFVMYLVTYYCYNGKVLLARIPHSPTRSTQLVQRDCCYQVYWRYLWMDFVSFFSRPSPYFLHYFAVGNFFFNFFQILMVMLTYLPNLQDQDYAWLYSLNISGYGACKFALGGFYIVRYQLTLREFDDESPKLVMLLWSLNAVAFLCTFISQFNDPPYIDLVPQSIGFSCTLLFAVFDTILNAILLYNFVLPIASHMKKLQQMINIQRGQADVTKKGRSEERRRMKSLKEVISWCVITCSISSTLTIADNLIYCLAYYVYPDVVSADGKYYIWYVLYVWVLCAEAVFCAVMPAANYRSYQIYWKICSCRKQIATKETNGRASNLNKKSRTEASQKDAEASAVMVGKEPIPVVVM
jgi:hypothetical protein